MNLILVLLPLIIFPKGSFKHKTILMGRRRKTGSLQYWNINQSEALLHFVLSTIFDL